MEVVVVGSSLAPTSGSSQVFACIHLSLEGLCEVRTLVLTEGNGSFFFSSQLLKGSSLEDGETRPLLIDIFAVVMIQIVVLQDDMCKMISPFGGCLVVSLIHTAIGYVHHSGNSILEGCGCRIGFHILQMTMVGFVPHLRHVLDMHAIVQLGTTEDDKQVVVIAGSIEVEMIESGQDALGCLQCLVVFAITHIRTDEVTCRLGIIGKVVVGCGFFTRFHR